MSDVNLSKAALERATATFTAIRAPRLHGRYHHLFGARRWWILRRDYEDLWAYADTLSALFTLGSLPRQNDPLDVLHAMVRGLRSYSRVPGVLEPTGDAGFESVVTPALGGGGDRYYDDNAWLGLCVGDRWAPHRLPHQLHLPRVDDRRRYQTPETVYQALVRHHELTGNAELLALAQRVFSFVVNGGHVADPWRGPLEGTDSQPLSQHLREWAGLRAGGTTLRKDREHVIPQLGDSYLRLDAQSPTRS